MHVNQISAILNVHNEDDLIDRSFNSLMQAVDSAKNINIETELIIVADNPSTGIIDYFKNKESKAYTFYTVNFKDLSSARNYGAQKSNGKYIAFFDGDDLWSANWLTECFKISELSECEIICHPEASIYFEQKNQVFFHADSESKDFYPWQLIENNLWTSQIFLPRRIFLENPQIKLNIENGFGYEDWEWNCNTLAKGIQHKAVEQTYHFIRDRNKSLSAASRSNNCLLPQTILFNSNSHIKAIK